MNEQSDLEGIILRGKKADAFIYEDLPEFYANCAQVNPYFSPGWVQAWRESLGKYRDLVLVLVRNTDNYLAFWPFFECNGLFSQGLWPLGAETADNFSPLYQDEEALDKLLESVLYLLKSYSFAWLPLVGKDFCEKLDLESLKDQKIDYLLRERTESHQLEIPEQDFDEFYNSRVGKTTQKTLRRSERRLADDGELHYRTWTEKEEVDAVLTIIMAIENKSWKGREKVGAFSKNSFKDFYKIAVPLMAEYGDLKIDTLAIGDRIVAYEFSFETREKRYLHNMAYLPEFKSYSPGTILLKKTLKDAFNNGLEWVDFLQGTYEYKTRFATYNTPLLDLNLFSKNWKGQLNKLAVQFMANRQKKKLEKKKALVQ